MIEIIFGIVGVWMLIVGKAPAWLAGKGYEVNGVNARWIGFVLALPMPISIVMGILLGLLLGDDSFGVSLFIEVVVLIASLVIAWQLIKKYRTPVTPNQQLNA